MISISFLSYVYLVEFYYAGSYGHGTMTPSEAGAYQWIHNNTPRNAVILTYSYPSYTRLISLTGRKAISYIMGDSKTVSWPLGVTFNSYLPEVTLYSLKELGVTHIFLTSQDKELLSKSKGLTLLKLLDAFLIAYESEGITIYKIPKYPLFNDSNYILVQPTLDFGVLTDSIDTLKSYQTAFNMLTASNIYFNVTTDMELNSLKTANVYVFPSNLRVTEDLFDGLLYGVTRGAHIIFMNPRFASLDELSSTRESALFNALDINLSDVVTSSSIVFEDGFQMNFTTGFNMQKLVFNDSSVRVMANYLLSNGSKTPYIMRKNVNTGSVTFIYSYPLMESDALKEINQREFFAHTLTTCIEEFPKPNVPKDPLVLPYPPDLYKLLNPIIIDIYNCKGLHGYLFGYDDTHINGHCTIESNYILWNLRDLPVEKVVLANATSYIIIEGRTLNDLAVKGHIDVTLETTNVTILNRPTGILADVSLMAPTRIQLALKNGELSFNIEDNETFMHFHLSQGNITIVTTSDPETLNLRLKHPIIAVDGVLQTSWEGSFLHEGRLYSTISFPRIWPITGVFKLQIHYSSGTMLAKINDIYDVSVVILPDS